MPKYYPSIIHRLEANSKIDLVTGCIEWQLSRDKDGYGQIIIDGKRKGTHRVVAEIFLPDYSKELEVRHFVCDNPPCINPQHLRMGTSSDNRKDMVSKGRHGGTNQWSGYISEDEISDIKGYRALGLTQQQIADIFGISNQIVSVILRR